MSLLTQLRTFRRVFFILIEAKIHVMTYKAIGDQDFCFSPVLILHSPFPSR